MPRKKQPIPPGKPPRRKPGTGTVRSRSDGRYELTWTMPDAFGRQIEQRVYLSKVEYTLEQANAYLDERIAERDAGAILRDRITLAEYLPHWMATFPRRAGTNRNRAYHVHTYLIPALGHLDIAELTKRHCRALWQQMRDHGRSLALTRNVRATLIAALRDAEHDPLTEDLIDGNVARSATLPQWTTPTTTDTHEADEDDTPRISTADVRAIIDAQQHEMYKLAIMLCAYLGLRVGEAFGLAWSNLDDNYTGLWVRQTLVRASGMWVLNGPKTTKGRRWLPVFGDLIPAFEQRKVQQEHEQQRYWDQWFKNRDAIRLDGKVKKDLVFTYPHGTPIFQQSARRALRAACERAGVEPIRWHQLRHTTNSLLIELGVDDMTRLIIMGHANVATNRTYSHAEKEDLRRRMSPLEARLKQG
jgi:integrase